MAQGQTGPRRILVINPNASEAVTAAIDAAVEPLRLAGGPTIAVDFLPEGPPGIASQEEADSVVSPILARIRRDQADAFLIACFSDPGLYAAREAANGRPVLGIAECALLQALSLGDQFGIIALSPASVKRQQRMVRQMGLYSRYAGSAPIDATAAESAADAIRSRLAEAGRSLVERQGAEVLVLGCASMASHRRALEDLIGRPVVEPTQQAVAVALGRVLLMAS